ASPEAAAAAEAQQTLRELTEVVAELGGLAHRGARLLRRAEAARTRAGADLDSLCAHAARLRTGPPAGARTSASGAPIRVR
ncbi:unnamed protein product, partial [Prorocentrum cordatum]